MSTYLQLVQQLVTELGIGGANQGATVPATLDGVKGQLWNAGNWVKQANNNLNLLHSDWQYLAVEYAETLTIGSTAVPAHSGTETVKTWDRRSFWIDLTTTGAGVLGWMDWEQYRYDVLPGPAATTNSKPSIITQKRDGSLILNVPCAAAYALTAEFYKRPDQLVNNGDLPEMPEEYHRLIICEAAIKYGNKEAAAEIINGMEAEYEMLLEKLRGDQLIGAEYESQYSQDVPIIMEIPGFDETLGDNTKRWR